MTTSHSDKRLLVLLNADDYAMTDGISDGIEQLASAGRLSAASVMTTARHWPARASRIAKLRSGLAIGLHFDLTLLGPLGPMPKLAPDGRLPTIAPLTRLAVLRRIDATEIAGEFERQLDAFETHLGFPPDHIDGHQHVHGLPVVRDGVLAVLARRFPGVRPLVRVSGDATRRICARGRHAGKALTLTLLSAWFARRVTDAGFPMNDGFAGVSDFADGTAAPDFAAAARAPGPLHLVMCHPGIPDDELARIDPVIERRREELKLLGGDAALPFRVWRPARAQDGPPIDWRAVATQFASEAQA